jgi:hypothetical protein
MNSGTMLLRQVHPSFFSDGQLLSQAFIPFPKDTGGLSVYDGDVISPREAFRHYTKQQNLQSIGVWAVQCQEANTLDLSCRPDPLPENPAHALIDFGDLPQKAWRKLAKKLRNFALTHGCLYAP